MLRRWFGLQHASWAVLFRGVPAKGLLLGGSLAYQAWSCAAIIHLGTWLASLHAMSWHPSKELLEIEEELEVLWS
jgi:hypothetical protein